MNAKQLILAKLTYPYYLKYRKYNSPKLSAMYTLDYLDIKLNISLDDLAYFDYHVKHIDVLEMELITNYSYLKGDF